MPNTEKPSTKSENKKMKEVKTKKAKPEEITDAKPVAEEKIKQAESVKEKEALEDASEKKEDKEKKKEIEKPKKTEAVINADSIPVSKKKSMAICRFIKGKKIGEAIRDLELVVKLKKVIPMRGEIPHRRGKGISSGRYPQKTAKEFIILLKSLAANASELNEPIISEAIANMASRPYGRFGRIRKKRTHIRIIAREKKMLNKFKGKTK